MYPRRSSVGNLNPLDVRHGDPSELQLRQPGGSRNRNRSPSPRRTGHLDDMYNSARFERAAQYRAAVPGWSNDLEGRIPMHQLEEQLADRVEQRTGSRRVSRTRNGGKRARASRLERSRPSPQQQLGGGGPRARTAAGTHLVKSVGDLSMGSASTWKPSGNSRLSSYVTNPAAFSEKVPKQATVGLSMGRSLGDLYLGADSRDERAGGTVQWQTVQPVRAPPQRQQRRQRPLKPGLPCEAFAKSKGWMVPAVILEMYTDKDGYTIAHVQHNLTLAGHEHVVTSNDAEFRHSDKPLTHQTTMCWQKWQALQAEAKAAKEYAAVLAEQDAYRKRCDSPERDRIRSPAQRAVARIHVPSKHIVSLDNTFQ